MTQPIPPDQPTNPPAAEAGATQPGPMPPQLGLSTQLVPQGDTTLVGLTINYGYSSFTMAISQQAAIQLANALPKMLAEAVNEAKRAQYGGLVIASPDQLRTLPPINGHGRPA